MKNQGSSGKTAPTAKARKETPAAAPAEPAASGSMPSSRRAWVSSATWALAERMRATVSASAAGTPRARYMAASSRCSASGSVASSSRSTCSSRSLQLFLGPDGHQLARGHGKGAGEQAGDARQAYRRGVGGAPGDPEDQRDVGDQAVTRAEDGRPGGVALHIAVAAGPGRPVSHQPGRQHRGRGPAATQGRGSASGHAQSVGPEGQRTAAARNPRQGGAPRDPDRHGSASPPRLATRSKSGGRPSTCHGSGACTACPWADGAVRRRSRRCGGT